MRRIRIHHIHLTLGMIDGASLILLISCYDLLGAIWTLLSWLDVTSVRQLLLVALENLRRVSGTRAD